MIRRSASGTALREVNEQCCLIATVMTLLLSVSSRVDVEVGKVDEKLSLLPLISPQVSSCWRIREGLQIGQLAGGPLHAAQRACRTLALAAVLIDSRVFSADWDRGWAGQGRATQVLVKSLTEVLARTFFVFVVAASPARLLFLWL